MINTEDVQTKYWAMEVLSADNQSDIDKLSGSLTSSKIDLNPHQIEAALFALKSPISKGAILADEVGLGKTIEAGLVISEYYSRGQTSILVIAPASLCPQWQTEMQEKFDLPSQVIDRTLYNESHQRGIDPFLFKGLTICSYHFASQNKVLFKGYAWDLVVIDEAHKLRNLYKGKTKIADGIADAFADRKKLLLTATPIQNTLMDIYSLVSLIDPNIFSNEYVFMENYLYSNKRHSELRKRLECVLHRTLRKDVLEYIKYTNREAMTVAFNPTKAEEELYLEVSNYISKTSKYAITTHFRTLIILMMRKLMSSSTSAIKGTLEGIRDRLLYLEQNSPQKENIVQVIKEMLCVENGELDEELEEQPQELKALDRQELEELAAERLFVEDLIKKASRIKVDGKTDRLIEAIGQGFEKMAEKGGAKKAIIFTESTRTLRYLFDYLSKNGFKDKIVTFDGSNNSPLCKQYYDDFIENHSSDLTGSKSTDMKKALVAAFKGKAEIMIATEAAAEGLNLQFCSLLVNYDLPWNPQRIEQRIGRVHRYGQKSDVVIINFINKKNLADVRLYEILQYKFKLFDGVFGASDEILGSLSDGVDFEKAVANIFELCRTPDEINRAFDELQASLGAEKDKKLEETKQLVLENLNPSTQEKLSVMKKRVENYLDRNKQIFWKLSKNIFKAHYPKFLINETEKLFGEFEEHVFGRYTEQRFSYNTAFQLNYNKRDDSSFLLPREKKALKRQPTPYNPTSEFGEHVINKAMDISIAPSHILVKSGSTLRKGLRGRLKISLYKHLTPVKQLHIISTFISDSGGMLNINLADFFDNVMQVDSMPLAYGYHDFLNQLHEQALAKYEKAEKKKNESLLKSEIEKLNRWLVDEKRSIKLKAEKGKNKLASLKRSFKAEKVLKNKIELGKQIQLMQAQLDDTSLNSFDIERSLETKCNRLIGGKKRSLKYTATSSIEFDCSFEIV